MTATPRASVQPIQDGESDNATGLHLGCGTDYREGWCNVDVDPSVRTDVRMDVTETPWEQFDTHQFDRVRAAHLLEHFDHRTLVDVLGECARVLRVGGVLEVTVPTGANYDTDDDHETRWTYESPEQYSRIHQRHWDPSLPLDLVEREIDVWLGGPMSPASPLLRLAGRVWPRWALRRCYAGELTAVYRRVGR